MYYGRNQKSQPQRMSPILYHAEDPRKHALEMPYGFYPQVAYMAAMLRPPRPRPRDDDRRSGAHRDRCP